MPVIYQKFVNRLDLRANPKVMYLFGDNAMRLGLGGQAGEMRGEPNAVGICTKRRPNMSENSFFSDDTYDKNVEQIELDLAPAVSHLKSGGIVVIPLDGLGTGLSQLPERAPDTNEYLVARLKQLAEAG